MPHLDPSKRIERAYAAEQARAARVAADRAENAARIREQAEPDPRGCTFCGDPHAPVNENGECKLCERRQWEEWAKEKLSPEEIYPEHFPEGNDDDNE